MGNLCNMGENTYERLKSFCEDAWRIQERTLLEILKGNRDTEFGRRYGFSEIKSAHDYQETVPFTDYSDYEDYIERGIRGERNLLTATSPIFYCISSGSTTRPKYIPVTEADIRMQKTWLFDDVTETVRRETKVSCGELNRKIFETGDFFQTFMPDGTMNGVRSGALHRFLEKEGEILWERYTAPREVLFPTEMEDMLYVKLRFALNCREVTAINGLFVHRLVGMLEYVISHWQEFLADIETGSVNECFFVSGKWRDYLRKRLPPNPVRAAELGAFDIENLEEGFVKKVWPEIKYVRAIGGSLFSSCDRRLKRYIGNLPVHPYAYAASEGVFGVPVSMNTGAGYVLIPEACFFEFADPGDDKTPHKKVKTFQELEKGKRYEPIVTTRSGLYRYEMGDVVEVMGFYGRAPIVQICYRKNQIMDLADERMNGTQLDFAMLEFSKWLGITIVGYCVDADRTCHPPCYIIYAEPKKGEISVECMEERKACEKMDFFLSENCFAYKAARQMGEIAPARLVLLPNGSFGAYEKFLADRGYRMEQNKPLRVLYTKEQREFFEKFVTVHGTGKGQ